MACDTFHVLIKFISLEADIIDFLQSSNTSQKRSLLLPQSLCLRISRLSVSEPVKRWEIRRVYHLSAPQSDNHEKISQCNEGYHLIPYLCFRFMEKKEALKVISNSVALRVFARQAHYFLLSAVLGNNSFLFGNIIENKYLKK